MSASLVTSLTAAPGWYGGTTGAIDTTGANFILISIAYVNTIDSVTDSKGNTYTALTEHANANLSKHRFYYVRNPTVGTGHTFTVSGAQTYPGIVVHAFSDPVGAPIFESENGAAAASGTSIATGSVTPATSLGSLVVSGVGVGDASNVPTPDAGSGYVSSTRQPGVGGTAYCATLAYKIQVPATATNTTWTWGASAVNSTSIAIFSSPAPTVVVTGANGGTSAAINTTGAKLLVASASWDPTTTADVTISDSKGNTWIPLTKRTAGNAAHQLFYVSSSPVVGTGHTFTIAGTSINAALIVNGFTTGPYVFGSENGAVNATSTSPLATGAVKPPFIDSLVVSGVCADAGTAFAVDSSLIVINTNDHTATGKGAALAGLVIAGLNHALAPVNPSWSWTSSGSGEAASSAVFQPASVGTTIKHVATVTMQGTASSGGTTAAIDTTGANLIVMSVHSYNTVTVSDSKGNLWFPLPEVNRGSSNVAHRWFYAKNPIVGSGHTFSVSGSSIYPVLIVHAFSGSTNYPFEAVVQNTTDLGYQVSFPAGTVPITPLNDESLVMTALSLNGSTDPQLTTGYWAKTILEDISGVCINGAMGWQIQTTKATVDPAWTWTGHSYNVGSSIVFRPSTVSTPTDPYVNTAFVSGGSVSATTSAFNLVAGNTVIVGVRWGNGDQKPVSVTDSVGNTYTRLANAQWTGDRCDIWASFNVPTGGAAVTVTVNCGTGSQFIYVRALQYAFGAAACFVQSVNYSWNNGYSISSPYRLKATAAGQFVVMLHNIWNTGINSQWNPEVLERGDDGTLAMADQPLFAAGDWCVPYASSSGSWVGQQIVGVLISPSAVTITNDWTHKGTVSASGNTGATSAALDTTGADFLIIGVGTESNPAYTVSDSKGNTWIPLLRREYSAAFRFWYAKNATVGTGHTFTVSGPVGSRIAFIVNAFSGGHPTDPLQPGSEYETYAYGSSLNYENKTSLVNGGLIITGFAGQGTPTNSVNLGGTETDVAGGANNVAVSVAWLLQVQMYPVQISWSYSPDNYGVTTQAMFFGDDLPVIDVRGTQVGVEVLSTAAAPVRITEAGVEVMATAQAPTRITQAGVEVLWVRTTVSGGIWMGDGGGNIWIE